jgi:hypothetical protein
MESARRLIEAREEELTASFRLNPEAIAPEDAKQALEKTLHAPARLHPPTNTIVVTTHGQTTEILEASRLPWLNKVHVSEANPEVAAFGVPKHLQVPSAASTLDAHWRFNDQGFAGTGQRLGLMDAIEPGCQIFHEHEAFSKTATVVYQDSTPLSCTKDDQCGGCAATRSGYQGVCRAGRCVSVHTTAAAGAMAAHQSCGDPSHDYCEKFLVDEEDCSSHPELDECDPTYAGDYMAARAGLYVANAGDVNQDFARIAAYEWFSSKDVRIVAEPYQLGSLTSGEPSSQDILQDNYSRYDDMVFVRSAANNQAPTTCNGLNAICVGGHQVPSMLSIAAARSAADSDGTPSVQFGLDLRNPQKFEVYDASSWQNPLPPSAFSLQRPYEVSRPHISALAKNVWLPDVGDGPGAPLWKWNNYDGNSFAGPAIAALLALFQEHCGADIDSRYLRARLLASGYRGIGIEERYRPDPSNVYIANRTGPQPLPPDTPDVCKGPPFDSGLYRGRYLRFPTADERLRCDYGQGVGPANASALAWLCGPVAGGGSGGTSGQSDDDGQSESIFGEYAPAPGPGGLDPRDSESTGGTAVLTPSSGTPIDASVWKQALTGAEQVDLAVLGMVPKDGTSLDRLREGSASRVITIPAFQAGMPAGESIRASLVYDSCPNAPTLWDNGVVNNIDIALCGRRADNGVRQCIAISESLDDSMEGFHIVTPVAFSSLSLLIIQQDPLEKCQLKDNSIPSTASEPVAWELLEWP